jgi:predicted DNA-binding protein with PD1-like motif
MEYFETEKTGKTFVLRLDPGDFVLESINEMIIKENIDNAVVVSGIGTLDRCIMHMVTTCDYPPQEYFDKKMDVPLELASMQGVIADGKPHIHVVVSDTHQAYAGHLEPGCRILYLGEVVIQEFPDLKLQRLPNEKGISRLHRK